MALGENIRAWRERKGWSTYRLADEADIAQSNVSRYEQNLVRPRRAILERIAKALEAEVPQLEYGSASLEVVPVGKRRIPILDYVQAGRWTGVAPVFRDEEMTDTVLTDVSYSSKAFALIVRGESMLPLVTPGEILTVDPDVSPRPGDMVVAADRSGEATVKTYAHVGVNKEGRDIIELRPANPVFPVWNSETTPFRIVGTVVEATRRFRSR